MWSKTLSKIHQTRANMGPKSVQNRSLRGSWGSWGRVLGGSWGGLGALGGHLGPKMAPRANISRTKQTLVSPIGGQVGSQNRAKIGPKSIQDVIIFLIGCWIGFKSILVPIWLQFGSQTIPKWSQVGSKIDPTWSIVFEASFGRMLHRICLVSVVNLTWPRARMHWPCKYEMHFVGV